MQIYPTKQSSIPRAQSIDIQIEGSYRLSSPFGSRWPSLLEIVHPISKFQLLLRDQTGQEALELLKRFIIRRIGHTKHLAKVHGATKSFSYGDQSTMQRIQWDCPYLESVVDSIQSHAAEVCEHAHNEFLDSKSNEKNVCVMEG